MRSFYAYSPYGEVAVLGPDEGNALRYTGREDDGTALYYYRARYYDPGLKRFISEDPIGIEEGR
jgi:RHS repeat-associated protein